MSFLKELFSQTKTRRIYTITLLAILCASLFVVISINPASTITADDTTININSTGDKSALSQAPIYNVTINAHCNTEAADINVFIYEGGSLSGYNTSYTFTGLFGTNNFTVPSSDPSGHPFKQWNNGENSTTIFVNSAGSYTAIYEALPTVTYNVTINAHCNTESKDINVPITKDISPSGQNTSYTFSGLTGSHSFTVPSADDSGHPFKQWSNGVTSTTINVTESGTYTAIYEGTVPTPTPPPQCKYCVTINAYCNTQHSSISVLVIKDGVATNKSTPVTFSGLNATHTFTIPNQDKNGHPFKQWNTGENSTTLTITKGGTYTAIYEAPTQPTSTVCPTPPPTPNPWSWHFPIWAFWWNFWRFC